MENMKRRVLAAGLVLTLAASGCTAPEEEQVEEQAAGKTDNTESAETPVADEDYVVKTAQTRSATELVKEALFETELQAEDETVRLYVLASDGAQRTSLSDTTYAGEAGDPIVDGGLAFYLADPWANNGYLQEGITGKHLVNLNRKPFTVHPLDGSDLVQLTEPLSSDGQDLTFWMVQDGVLKAVKAGDGESIPAATGKVKIVQDHYVQTYEFSNAEPVGWTFRTYEWKPETAELALYDETDLFVEGPFPYEGAEEDIRGFYQEMIGNWNEIDSYAYPFPHLEYPADLKERMAAGWILAEDAKIGGSVSAYLQKHPDVLGEYDAEGAWYYAFPDGQSIYHHGGDEIIAADLSGANYQASLEELRGLLGEPDSEQGSPVDDEPGLEGTNYDIGSTLTYELGAYTAEVRYRDDTVSAIYLYEHSD